MAHILQCFEPLEGGPSHFILVQDKKWLRAEFFCLKPLDGRSFKRYRRQNPTSETRARLTERRTDQQYYKMDYMAILLCGQRQGSLVPYTHTRSARAGAAYQGKAHVLPPSLRVKTTVQTPSGTLQTMLDLAAQFQRRSLGVSSLPSLPAL